MLPVPDTITTKNDAVSRCRNLEGPSLLVPCNPMTSQPFAAQVLSRVSMWPIPLTPLTAAVRTLNVPNVSSSSRDLALAALCFLRADFLSPHFPVVFSEQIPSAFYSVPGASYPGYCLRSSDVLGTAFCIVQVLLILLQRTGHPGAICATRQLSCTE